MLLKKKKSQGDGLSVQTQQFLTERGSEGFHNILPFR